MSSSFEIGSNRPELAVSFYRREYIDSTVDKNGNVICKDDHVAYYEKGKKAAFYNWQVVYISKQVFSGEIRVRIKHPGGYSSKSVMPEYLVRQGQGYIQPE